MTRVIPYSYAKLGTIYKYIFNILGGRFIKYYSQILTIDQINAEILVF